MYYTNGFSVAIKVIYQGITMRTVVYKLFWQYLLPQHFLSRLVGKITNCRWHWLKNYLINLAIKHYKIDMSIAEKNKADDFIHFNDFFTRSIKLEFRPIVSGENTIASPADGYISQTGIINDGNIFQAKGHYFNLLNLLGGSAERAAPFMNGKFSTIYLSPRDYHRVHMPISGNLREMIYIPGKLFSVNQSSVSKITSLFARNERVVCLFDTPLGPMALILVGAMFVASIATVWSGVVAPNENHKIQYWSYESAPLKFAKGAEMGRFQFGSTVILLFANSQINWLNELVPDQPIKLGQLLAKLI